MPEYDQPRDEMICDILQTLDHLRAIFCWSDVDTIPLLIAAHRLGVRVPGDLALIGYDNSPMAGLLKEDLTLIDQDGPASANWLQRRSSVASTVAVWPSIS